MAGGDQYRGGARGAQHANVIVVTPLLGPQCGAGPSEGHGQQVWEDHPYVVGLRGGSGSSSGSMGGPAGVELVGLVVGLVAAGV